MQFYCVGFYSQNKIDSEALNDYICEHFPT